MWRDAGASGLKLPGAQAAKESTCQVATPFQQRA